MLLERARQLTVEGFLDFAEASEERYEFIDGELCQMTGSKINHFEIITNLMDQLLFRIGASGYRRYGAGMLIRAGVARLLSPDVMVVRGEPETEAGTRVLLNPIVVVEVTSPTSMTRDRGAKLDYYFDVPSIEACLIVDQHRALVELHSRGEAGWRMQSFADMDDEVHIPALDCRLPLRDIYKNVDFAADDLSSEVVEG